MEWAKTKSGEYYEATWRWVEDTYLKFFGENRTSYGVKETLRKGEITGIKDIDETQHAVTDTVGNTFSKGHIGESAGKAVDTGLLRGNV